MKSRRLEMSSISTPIGLFDAAITTNLSLCAIEIYRNSSRKPSAIKWENKNCFARIFRPNDQYRVKSFKDNLSDKSSWLHIVFKSAI